MEKFGIILALICILAAPFIYSYPFYAPKIPSTDVPIWCGNITSNISIVDAVGHQLCGGEYFNTSMLNPFGKHFRERMDDWKTLCKMDSDNDTRSNGVELGDPECRWTFGTTLHAVSHPGYAEDEIIDPDTQEVSYQIRNTEEACGNPDTVKCWRYILGEGLIH